jgi:hypothetical protein
MKDNRIEYYGKSRQKLKYTVCKSDGTPKGAPLHPLPESQTPGYYTAISDIDIEKGDKVMIYGPEEVLDEIEPVTDYVESVTVDEPVGRGEFSAEQGKAGQGKPTSGEDKAGDIKKLFRFNKAQAFYDEKDLKLSTGAEVNPVEILRKLIKSFGKVVTYKDLDENSSNTASDFLRGKIRVIRRALEKHKVPCKIEPKRWTGYVLSSSRTHS